VASIKGSEQQTASSPGSNPADPAWRASGLRYHALSWALRQQFGCRVWKVSLDGGFGCPNADGTISRGGCVFCNIRSFSPSRRVALQPVAAQLADGITRLRTRYNAQRFLAYFQPATNTYGSVRRLRTLYEEALQHPDVVGLVVGTRPDCVPDEILALLAELACRAWVLVELGLQTVHDRTLRWMNRGHDFATFVDAVARCRRWGLPVGAHVILGLPGESRDDMRATASEVSRLGLHSVKLHNLYVARDTPLAEMFAQGQVSLLDLPDYAAVAADFLELLPPECVIDRLGADAPAEYLVAPAWCADKHLVRAAVEAELIRRNTWQGRRHAEGCQGGGPGQGPIAPQAPHPPSAPDSELRV